MRQIDEEELLKLCSDTHNPYHSIVREFLMTAPTVDAEPVRHGRWIPSGDDMWLCSNCKENIIFSLHESDRTEKQRYCCRCGARMDVTDTNFGNIELVDGMDKAKILRQCNEIERAVNELYVKDSITRDERIALINMIGVIVTEITAHPKSNGDRIRQMTDDEELLSAIGTGCYRCVYNNGECDSGYGKGCVAGNLEWLRKEANENAGSKTD